MVQMPALNTPQFSWVRNRLPRKPQPVPPIYQPEIAAEAIVWASHHARREVNVGVSTTIAILANKIVPGILDRYLARSGFDSQQTPEWEAPDRQDNLWRPVPGDHGAHGGFDDQARDGSAELWAVKHRSTIAAAALGIGGTLIMKRARQTNGDRRNRARKASGQQ